MSANFYNTTHETGATLYRFPEDLTGRLFGRLTVVRPSRQKTKCGKYRWLCRCECGNTVLARPYSLKVGHIKSCGCLFKDMLTARNTKHGMSDSVEYRAWLKMKERCLNPANKDFHHYGGRGITVCDEWRKSFDTFYAHLGPRPKDGTLDRIDNDGNYEPGNVRWASRKRQANNTRRNRQLTYKGETLTVAQWARKAGLTSTCLYQRLRAEWPIERAMNEPQHDNKVGSRQGRAASGSDLLL